MTLMCLLAASVALYGHTTASSLGMSKINRMLKQSGLDMEEPKRILPHITSENEQGLKMKIQELESALSNMSDELQEELVKNTHWRYHNAFLAHECNKLMAALQSRDKQLADKKAEIKMLRLSSGSSTGPTVQWII